MNTLPWPLTPSSVCTAISVWTKSAGSISALQPPFGVSPISPAATMDLIFMVSLGIYRMTRARKERVRSWRGDSKTMPGGPSSTMRP